MKYRLLVIGKIKNNHDFNLAQSVEKTFDFYLFCASDWFNGDIICKTKNTENK